jgi:hypothetical protein
MNIDRDTKNHHIRDGFLLAPGVGFEPTTNGLTVHCSTAELPRNEIQLWRDHIVLYSERQGASLAVLGLALLLEAC